MLNNGHTVIEVAKYLQVHRSTIYREMDRGKYIHRNTDYTEEERYSSDLGQQTHDWNAQGKGKALKIGKDQKLADFSEKKIADDKFSPEAALAEADKSGLEFKTSISVRTLYRYIDNNIFLKLTNKELPVKGKRGVTKSCLLVLTERKTRDEIIVKLPDQTARAVVKALDMLERKWGICLKGYLRA